MQCTSRCFAPDIFPEVGGQQLYRQFLDLPGIHDDYLEEDSVLDVEQGGRVVIETHRHTYRDTTRLLPSVIHVL